MLDKNDLHAIDQLFDKKLDVKLKPIKQSIADIDGKVTSLDQKIIKLDKKLSKKIDKLDEKSDLIIRSFDREYTTLRKRVDRVESHLNLPPFPSDL